MLKQGPRRLEREENARLEVARLEKLAEMTRQLEDERQRIKDAGGVIYKGVSSCSRLAVCNHSCPI